MKFRSMRVHGKGRSLSSSPPSFLLLCSLFVLPLLLASLATPALAGNGFSSPKEAEKPAEALKSVEKPAEALKSAEKPAEGLESAEAVDSCFCKIDSGILEDCPCDTKSIDQFNTNQIHQKVLDVLGSDYFRYFQVNFNKPCQFWEDGDGQCGSRNCAVDTCPATEVPEPVLQLQDQLKEEEKEGEKEHTFSSYVSEKFHEFLPLLEPLVVFYRRFAADYLPASAGEQCSGSPLPAYSRVDTTLPRDSAHLLNEFCTLDPLEAGDSCHYIDLTKNEEKFTGYQGKSANKIWTKIYSDLCFSDEEGSGSGDKCLEERTFYRIVSGLHSSITVHLCRNYLLQEENILLGKPAVWGPNVQEFRRRFDPALTGGQGPEWLKNIYYLYLVELRAIAKAGQVLTALNYGDPGTAARVAEIVETAAAFENSFDERQLFDPADRSSEQLLQLFKHKFRQISHMMDCMGCERCKVWGKLQVTGIGTALKILFTPSAELRLTRHETVALINGFGRVSTSLRELESFRAGRS